MNESLDFTIKELYKISNLYMDKKVLTNCLNELPTKEEVALKSENDRFIATLIDYQDSQKKIYPNALKMPSIKLQYPYHYKTLKIQLPVQL